MAWALDGSKIIKAPAKVLHILRTAKCVCPKSNLGGAPLWRVSCLEPQLAVLVHASSPDFPCRMPGAWVPFHHDFRDFLECARRHKALSIVPRQHSSARETVAHCLRNDPTSDQAFAWAPAHAASCISARAGLYTWPALWRRTGAAKTRTVRAQHANRRSLARFRWLLPRHECTLSRSV